MEAGEKSRVDLLCEQISELTRAEIEEVQKYCRVRLSTSKGEAEHLPPWLRDVFDQIRDEADNMGVRSTSQSRETTRTQHQAAKAIYALMEHHGPTNQVERRSLIRDMVRREVEDMRDAGYEDFSAKHLFTRLSSPRTSIEKMYPGYIDAGLLRLIGGLTKRKVTGEEAPD